MIEENNVSSVYTKSFDAKTITCLFLLMVYRVENFLLTLSKKKTFAVLIIN